MHSKQKTSDIIRIGTRSSSLALWQANTVSDKLNNLGYQTQIVPIDSIGDVVLNKPLYELGITGVFTKNLDIALLNDKIDIAVHSFKDVPTKLPKGIVEAAVIERGEIHDVLVLKNDDRFLNQDQAVIATGSLRRKAQWLNRYPTHEITGLRGNVNTRLKRLQENNWNGAIFAKAGLERICLLPEAHLVLDWMIPAPAQGAVMIAAKAEDTKSLEACSHIHDKSTALCVGIERKFLQVLEGGCTAPIGATARIEGDSLYFKGVLHSPNGQQSLEYEDRVPLEIASRLGRKAAEDILSRGGKKLMSLMVQNPENHAVYSTKQLSGEQLNMFDSSIKVSSNNFIKIQPNKLDKEELNSTSKTWVFTSSNAVKALVDQFDTTSASFGQIFCVGERTKSFIEKHIGKVSYVGRSALDLAQHITKQQITDITFFCGQLRRDELPQILQEQHVNIQEIECYQTVLTPKKITEPVSAILFFSPSGIESFIKENKPQDIVAFCIGETTGALAKKFFEHVIISKETSLESVIESVNNHLKTT